MPSQGEWKTVEIIVDASGQGYRIDQFLSQKYSIISRSDWQKRIAGGLVTVNGKPVRSSRKLNTNEVIAFRFFRDAEPEVNTDYSIVYKDSSVLVIDKPANLPVHPSGPYFHNTLTELLREKDLFSDKVHPVHRLDRETSGLLVFAVNANAAKILHASMLKGEITKEYRVIVEGAFPAALSATGFLDQDTISPVRKKRRFFAEVQSDESETSHTDFFGVQKCGPVSLLRAVLHTGRMHQIRATLFSLGYPVVGDKLYGVDDTVYLRFIEDALTPEDGIKNRLNRTALHSSGLGFIHPETGKRIDFESVLPLEMERLCHELS